VPFAVDSTFAVITFKQIVAYWLNVHPPSPFTGDDDFAFLAELVYVLPF
jgi:hypothetical protein